MLYTIQKRSYFKTIKQDCKILENRELVCEILSVKKVVLNIVIFLLYQKRSKCYDFNINVTFKNLCHLNLTISFPMEKFPLISAHVQFTFKWKELFFQCIKFTIAKAL